MREAPFTPDDLRRLEEHGLGRGEAERQLATLRNPPPPVRLEAPCTLGRGIVRLEEDRLPGLRRRFAEAADGGRALKLVPASGAASRMFSGLTAGRAEAIEAFSADLESLPFYPDLAAAIEKTGKTPGDLHKGIGSLLGEEGLGLVGRPKALIPFHRYGDEGRSAFEEHLVEAAGSLVDRDGRCRLHFTVAKEHESAFHRRLAGARPALEKRLGCRFEVTFSHQSPATDTLAVDLEDRPFRDDKGCLLLRPGGHGALIRNLAALGRSGIPDLILIKNIDNVVREPRQPMVQAWREALGGLVVETQERIFELSARLEGGTDPDLPAAGEAFLADTLGRRGAAHPAASPQARRRLLLDHLDRPLRVCGMVRNQGEPGGGPFWVRDREGGSSPQIVELSQIDLDDESQRKIVAASTHFNPVDLVCAIRDRQGHPYELERFVDPATVFITEKTHQGRPLRALERPGLWNGAMAGWNTIFVEVPEETFAPVKTVFDLLRPGHRAG